MARKNIKKLFYSLFIVLSASSLISCFIQKNEKTINLEVAEKISVGEQWVVIVEPYASFHEEADYNSLITGHARRGDVIKAEGRCYSRKEKTQKTEIWYKFYDGWLEQSAVNVFDNKLRAEKAAVELK